MQKQTWFRDVDSNHDTQLQRLMSYRLDDPGTAPSSLAEARNSAQAEPAAHALPLFLLTWGFC